MRAFWGAAIFVLCLALPGAAAPSAWLRGYPPAESAAERVLEARYLDIPTADTALDFVKTIAARPHYAGTPADYALAIFMRDRMRADGLRADVVPFTARVDTPRELVLALAPPADLRTAGSRPQRGRNADFPVALNLAETGDPGDPASGARAAGLPFNAGSGDGDVSAPLVYAGRGLEADYALLAQAHIDVRGAVVLVRYGAEFRGSLAMRAQSRGAAGLIFYNDPLDDGAARGIVAPSGPWRPPAAVERGWVGPGIRIPVLPVSAVNAQILLGSLGGTPGPASWTGALPVAYPLARGPGRVHLIVALNRKLTTLWNTVGSIAGTRGDQQVIVGAGRDAWVYGAGANGSGVATVLDVARGLGSLLAGGWRPQRTIVVAGWDGSELGAAGSRDYVFGHRFDVPRGCIAYLDAARTVTGASFGARATAALAPLIADAAEAVGNPLAPSASVYSTWAPAGGGAPIVDAPAGAGDDESFLANAGIAVAGMRFGGPFGVANSSYDTLHYATAISDPLFGLHRAAAQLYGIVALRLADAPGVPYDLTSYPGLVQRELVRLGAHARAAGNRLDATRMRAPLAGLADAARRAGRLPANAADWPGALMAVRTLNTLVYGTDGGAALALPDLSAAVSRRDQPLIDAALHRSIDAVNRAAEALPRTAAFVKR